MRTETLLALAGYGLLVCAPFVLNFLASRDDYKRYVDAFFMSAMLCVIWGVTNLFGVLWDFPESKRFHSLIDLIALSICVASYMTQRQRWKLVLAVLFLGQLCAHAWFWWMMNTNPAAVTPIGSIGRSYMAVLNVLWFAQIVCMSSPGAGRVVSIMARPYLRRGRRVPHLARH